MIKTILSLLMSPLFFMAAQAQEANFYAKILSGVNFLQNTALQGNRASYDTGYIISGSLGVNGPYGLSLEAEYAFRRNEISHIHFITQGSSSHGHFQASSYMGNILWNFPCSFWNIQPFIGLGIGYDFQQMHSSNSRIIFNQKWHHLSWQAVTGIAHPLFCHTDLTLEYKFHQGGTHFYNHTLGVGLLYNY